MHVVQSLQAVLVDARGTIIASGSIKTGAYPDVDEYVDAVCKNLLPLIVANGGSDKIKGIGIGAPNGNYYSGTIEFAPNLPWKGIISLAAMFEERLGIPTALTNDANAAAIGEMTYGAARGMKDFIMITLGTGVGSGIVINGQMVYGHDGFAGELGHTIIRRENGRQCPRERTPMRLRTQGLLGNLLLGYGSDPHGTRVPGCTHRTELASLHPR